jgi:hypothetical protein
MLPEQFEITRRLPMDVGTTSVRILEITAELTLSVLKKTARF